MANIMRILTGAKIRTEDDFRIVSELSSDTSASPGLRGLADKLLESYVADRSADRGGEGSGDRDIRGDSL